MKKIKFYLLVIGIGLLSCNSNRIFEKHQKDFPDYRWSKSNVLEFTPEIKDINEKYRVYLALRHVYGFQFEKLNVKVTSIAPNGEELTKKYQLAVFGPNMEYLSDCAEDICDLEVVIEEKVIFNKPGTYRYIIEQEMSIDPLPNVMEFGLIIEKHTVAK